MHAWLEANLRALLHRHGIDDENGEVELLLIALIAFMIGILVAGRRIIVQ